MTAEEKRLAAAQSGEVAWRRWGPYLSERQWGTVREDYSAGGTPWEYLPHDQAHARRQQWQRRQPDDACVALIHVELSAM